MNSLTHLFHIGSAVASALLLLVALPLLIELFVLSIAGLLPPRARRSVQAQTTDLQLAIVVPAHNEEQLIGPCVRSLLGFAQPDLTVFVVAHNCSDSTAQRATEAGAQVLLLNDNAGGKGLALQHGFQAALQSGCSGVLVVDADSIAGPTLVASVRSALAAGAHAVQCRYEVANPQDNARTALATVALLGMNVLRPRGRERLGLSCGIFGNGFALSSRTIEQVPYAANSLVEDLEYHLALLHAGRRVEFLNDAAVFGEMPTGSAAAATQRARWEGGRKLMRRRWAFPLLIEVLRGRLAMAEPLLDLLSVPLATGAALALVALLLALAGHAPGLTVAATAACLLFVFYVLAAALGGRNPARSLRALASAPSYLFWKVTQASRNQRAATEGSAWIRTARNQPETDESPAQRSRPPD